MNTVELNVRSKLLQVVDELNQIGAAAQKTADGLQDFSKKTGDNVNKQISKTEDYLSKIRSLTSRVAKGMADDFKALFNLTALTEGLKLSNVFRANIADTVELANTIRKLGDVFGITKAHFSSFQSKLTQGLGQIGASSEAASNALKGLSQTQVRGEDTLLEYSKSAAMLASLTRSQGKEGDIAQGIAGVITQRGGNSSDVAQMREVVTALKQQFTATGKSPTEILSQMATILEAMPKDLRKSLDLKSLIGVGVAGSVAGPNATKFLLEYLGKSPIARKSLEARGFGNLFTAQGGFDTKAFGKASQSVFSNFGQDPRLMAQTLGLSEDAAEGFVRLSESLDKIAVVQDKALGDNKSLERAYYDAMTAGEAFQASLNKFKSSFSDSISTITDKTTEFLKSAFGFGIKPGAITKHMPDALTKNLGSTAVVAGSGIVAALLAGGGLKGLLRFGMGKAEGLAERESFKSLSGEKVDDVYVVNAGEIGKAAGDSKGFLGGGVGGMLGKASLVAAAGFAGVNVGELINDKIQGTEVDKKLNDLFGYFGEKWGEIVNSIDKPYESKNEPESINVGGASRMGKVFKVQETETAQSNVSNNINNFNSTQASKADVNLNLNVKVESNNSDFKASVKGSRGGKQ